MVSVRGRCEATGPVTGWRCSMRPHSPTLDHHAPRPDWMPGDGERPAETWSDTESGNADA